MGQAIQGAAYSLLELAIDLGISRFIFAEECVNDVRLQSCVAKSVLRAGSRGASNVHTLVSIQEIIGQP
jgi:hypothetical protein